MSPNANVMLAYRDACEAVLDDAKQDLLTHEIAAAVVVTLSGVLFAVGAPGALIGIAVASWLLCAIGLWRASRAVQQARGDLIRVNRSIASMRESLTRPARFTVPQR